MSDEKKERNTIQRQLVYDAVCELNIHATAEQVYDYVVQKYPTISKATVYRNLSQMTESGMLLNIGSFHGSTHYDHNCSEHGHFICEKCKMFFDLDIAFSDIYARAGHTDAFEISGCSIRYYGLCRYCKVSNSDLS